MDTLRSIFAYGTLMEGYDNHRAYLASYPYTVQRGNVSGRLVHLPEGYPALLPGDGRVLGQLFTFALDDARFGELLARIDHLEGYAGPGSPSNLYERKILSVDTDSGPRTVFTYVYADPARAQRDGVAVPSGDWGRFCAHEVRLQVLVDADACPKSVLRILLQLECEYGFDLITVASYNHQIKGTNHVTVGPGRDEADLAIINRVTPRTVVVTQDWGLASLVLAKKARAISPLGHIYDASRIDFLLEERHTKAKARRAGVRTRGPRKRRSLDDERFERNMRALLAAFS